MDPYVEASIKRNKTSANMHIINIYTGDADRRVGIIIRQNKMTLKSHVKPENMRSGSVSFCAIHFAFRFSNPA